MVYKIIRISMSNGQRKGLKGSKEVLRLGATAGKAKTQKSAISPVNLWDSFIFSF